MWHTVRAGRKQTLSRYASQLIVIKAGAAGVFNRPHLLFQSVTRVRPEMSVSITME